MVDLAIRDATIVTQDERRRIIHGDILISQGRIVGIGAGIGVDAPKTIDASGRIAMPGLVNCHTHVSMSCFMGMGRSLRGREWLARMRELERGCDGRTIEVSARLSFLQMIKCGITAFADMAPRHLDAVARAARASGLRGLITSAVPSRLGMLASGFGIERRPCTDALIKDSVVVHSPMAGEEFLMRAGRYASGHGMTMQMHVAETEEDVRPFLASGGAIGHLEDLGLLGQRALLAHCCHISDEEIAIAGRRKVDVVHCPISNLALAVGSIAPVARLDGAGATLALGSDGHASGGSMDMFQIMRMASLLQNHLEGRSDALPAQKALDMGTRNGARALGAGTGSLEEGAPADIILLRGDCAMVPEHDLIGNIVHCAGAQHVSHTIVAGRILMEEGIPRTMDEEETVRDMIQLASPASKASGQAQGSGASRAGREDGDTRLKKPF